MSSTTVKNNQLKINEVMSWLAYPDDYTGPIEMGLSETLLWAIDGNLVKKKEYEQYMFGKKLENLINEKEGDRG